LSDEPETTEAEQPEEGPVWKRTAELVDVSFPKRLIELVVMPYESPIYVGWEGRTVRETIARGAFDGIQRRANRVCANVDHNETVPCTIGRAIAFHPGRDEGLVAEVKIAKTPLGDHTLALAADGDLGVSAGFRPMKGGLQWEGRDAYRITKAFLKHIAMTPDPAYEDAKVLAVRKVAPSVPSSKTPNLDQWRTMLADDRLAAVIRSDAALS
jgi:HK97 family phage prohead protease